MLAHWKESYDKHRHHVKKQRHHFAYTGPYSQSYGFFNSRVWMWELDYKESWALKNWWFWTVVLEKLLRVPWTIGRSNQSILKEISPEYSLEGLKLKLQLQYFGHLMRGTDSLKWTLILRKTEGRRNGWQRRDGWMALSIQLKWTWVWASSGSWWWTGKPGMQQSIGSQRVGHNWTTELNLWYGHQVRRKSSFPIQPSLTPSRLAGEGFFHFSLVRVCLGSHW